MPQIAVINESSAITDAEVQRMLPAFDRQWNQDLMPVWGVDKVGFAFAPKGQAPAAGTWWLVFLDDSDQAGALAYHDLTNEGLPISKVFVRPFLPITPRSASARRTSSARWPSIRGSTARIRIFRVHSGRARCATPSRIPNTGTTSAAF